MYYYAMIDYRTKVCYGVTSSETVSDYEYYIPNRLSPSPARD